MTTNDDILARLDALTVRLTQLEGPTQLAATDSSGNPSAVAAGQLIESAWGNAVVDRLVRRYATAAARNAAIPTPTVGTVTYVQGNNSVQLRDDTSQWIEPSSAVLALLGTQSNINGPVTIPGSGFTPRSTKRRYMVIAQVPVFKGGTAGGITIAPNPAAAGQTGVSRRFATPESGAITGIWFIDGSAGGGALTITPETGTVDVTSGGFVALVDVGSTVAQYT